MSWRPSASAASRNTRSRSYQCTDQPRASAAVARASRYITESAMVCARLSAIRSSIVGGSSGQARIAMLVIGTGTASSQRVESAHTRRAPQTRARARRAPQLPRATARALPGC